MLRQTVRKGPCLLYDRVSLTAKFSGNNAVTIFVVGGERLRDLILSPSPFVVQAAMACLMILANFGQFLFLFSRFTTQ